MIRGDYIKIAQAMLAKGWPFLPQCGLSLSKSATIALRQAHGA